MTVIGLNGNAGTGKSSTAMSVAKASNRNCIKINVGGVGGAEIIKGTNKTVHNAGPSMIIRELAKSGHGCYSDVIILDEVDKATPDFFNALYEFLDPNEEFIYDQYLGCHIPKNNFIVILTFNDIRCIPLPIRDRMEVIEYSNYSIQDKKVIISNYILPKLRDKFSIGFLTIEKAALELYVNHYDVLPGMRNVERDFEYILMNIARHNKGAFEDSISIDKELIQKVLGEKRTAGLNDIPPLSVGKCGMAQALAVTNGGIGVSTAVETVINPYQEKNVVVTGLLEGSCLESVSLACCLAAKYLNKELPKLHIHMTDAVKKDGPSAGVTITMSVLSCMLEKPLPNVAFTGSVDLYGNVGPVGGVFEKCIAAERTRVEKVIIPSECYKRLVDKKEIDRLNVEIVPVDTIDEVIMRVWDEGMEVLA
jgi:ATP-dependent Lon protease